MQRKIRSRKQNRRSLPSSFRNFGNARVSFLVSSIWPFYRSTVSCVFNFRLLLVHSLIVIVVEARITIRTGLTGETTSQRRWNGEFFPHVKQNIRFTLGDRVRGCWSYRAIVKVKPLSVVNSEGSVMSSSSTKMDIPIFILVQ